MKRIFSKKKFLEYSSKNFNWVDEADGKEVINRVIQDMDDFDFAHYESHPDWEIEVEE